MSSLSAAAFVAALSLLASSFVSEVASCGIMSTEVSWTGRIVMHQKSNTILWEEVPAVFRRLVDGCRVVDYHHWYANLD